MNEIKPNPNNPYSTPQNNPAGPAPSVQRTSPVPPSQPGAAQPAAPSPQPAVTPTPAPAPKPASPAPTSPTPSPNPQPNPAQTAAPQPTAATMQAPAQPQATMTSSPVPPQTQPGVQVDNPTQAVATATTKPKKSKKMLLIVIGSVVGLMLLGVIIGFIMYSQQSEVTSLKTQLEEVEQEAANLKVALAGGENGSVTNLLGGDDGNVAGATSNDDSTGGIYAGQVAQRGEKMLFEVYVEKDQINNVEAISIEYGSDRTNLESTGKLSGKDLNVLSQDNNVIVVEVNKDIVDPGRSYFYRVVADTKDGGTLKSGLNVFTSPNDSSANNQNSQNQSNNGGNNPSNPAQQSSPDLSGL